MNNATLKQMVFFFGASGRAACIGLGSLLHLRLFGKWNKKDALCIAP